MEAFRIEMGQNKYKQMLVNRFLSTYIELSIDARICYLAIPQASFSRSVPSLLIT